MLTGRKISTDFVSNLKFTEFTVFILNFLKNILKISDDDMFKIEISLREVINNAIIHGNKSDPNKRVFLDFEWKNRILKLTVTDQNTDKIDFNEMFERIKSKDVLSLNGRGIMIMNNYMDKVEFSNIELGTRVVLEKAV
ncbi:MAG: ATP-binding protein [Candidatus Aminicenantes bacterium]|nr:ATP-binding protein [Candidatus Aminicenantes bacterium]